MSSGERHLGRYRLFEPLGSGGMSVVYKGLDATLEREVAVKVLHPHLASNPGARERFAREARAVARLHHPNIVEVFDVSDGGAPEAYLVTEYIRGKTLKELLSAHPLRVPEAAVLIVYAIADALAHAHATQVIHRDVKPENVMVRDDGRLKLMDFGIAKVFDRDERMTQTGTLMGSPAHMAPEIIAGEEAHFPADVFSVGTLLYWALTGELPFTGTNTPALLTRILAGTYPDPREKAPAVSDALAAVVNRCLQRLPGDRFADAGALRDALAEVLQQAGLVDIEAEQAHLFADLDGYQTLLRARLVALRHQRAEGHLRDGKRASAVRELSLVLALEPADPKALGLMRSLRLRERRRRRLWKSVSGLIVVSGVVALVAAVPWGTLGNQKAQTPLRLPLAASRPSIRTELVPGEPVLLPTARVEPAPRIPPGPSIAPLEPLSAPAPAALSVSVLIRPFGQLGIDEAAPSGDALAQHVVALSPGRHRLTVSCEYCEDISEDVEVKPNENNVFRLRAQLKAADLVFRFNPVEATVRIAGEQRTARESEAHPFHIESPRGPPTFRHSVEYEVTAPGFKPLRKTILVAPGQLTLVEGALERS